jgi:hypothetical protein
MNTLAVQLVSTAKENFASALSAVKAEQWSENQTVDLVRTFLTLLDTTDTLPEREKCSRIIKVSRHLPLGARTVPLVIASVPHLSSSLRIAFAGALSPELRQLVYGIEAESLAQGEVSAVSAIPGSPRSTNTANEESEGPFQVVILAASDQDANIHLLSSHGFSPLSVDSRQNLAQILEGASGICGFLVDRSFWAKIPQAEHRDVVEMIAGYSSFAWLRIDTTNLALGEQSTSDVIRNATANPHPTVVGRLSIQSDSELKESQLDWLIAARESLEYGKSLISPGELNARESQLLECSLHLALSPELSGGARFKISPIRASFMKEGHTSAKVALITFDSSLQPMVVKVDKKELILEEACRFNRFIRPLDDQLDPRVFIHGSIGVLVFDLVAHPDNASAPAPTLEKRLEQLWYSELYPPETPDPSAPTYQGMATGLINAVHKLGRINRVPAGVTTPFRDFSSPSLKAIEESETNGRGWGFADAVVQARQVAQTRFASLQARAVVHGDVHVRNVLLRNDRDAFFIDYASSGAGHPSVDLVRLEMSLFFCSFRPMCAESQIVDVQVDLSVHGLGLQALMAKYPHVGAFASNRLWLETAIGARQECLNVLQSYGGTAADYISCKLLIAWTSLQIPTVPTSLARTIIQALAPHIV